MNDSPPNKRSPALALKAKPVDLLRNGRASMKGGASRKEGMPPGSLVHIGKDHQAQPSIGLTVFDTEHFESREVTSIDAVLAHRRPDSIIWVNVRGLTDIDLIEAIGQHFGIHRLVLEDILNTHQRPKCEDHDQFLYLVLKQLAPSRLVPDTNMTTTQHLTSFDYEQISILLIDGIVFTFQEKPTDGFEPIKQRIEANLQRFSSLGAAYLVYVLLDTIVDGYFACEERLADHIDDVEAQLLYKPSNQTLLQIQHLKRELITVRRAISPLRELLSNILRAKTNLVHPDTHIYFRDVIDHCLRIMETLDAYRDIVTGLLDIYISSISVRMNEIMKVLTVFATIFIPLTFITGIYGMNFDYMPELHWRWAYPALWLVFLSLSAGLLVYFKRKHWL